MAKAGMSVTMSGLVARVQGFFEDVLAELKKVTWPAKEELKASTSVVLVLLLLFAAVIGVMDVALGAIVVQLLTAA